MALLQSRSKGLYSASGGRVFAPQREGANNGGSGTLYNGIHNNSVQNPSSFAPYLVEEGANFAPRIVGGKSSELAKSLWELRSRGFYFKIHRFRSRGHLYIYLKARKHVNGRIKEITLARIEEGELKEVKKLIREVMSNNNSNGKPIDPTGNHSKTDNPSKSRSKAGRTTKTGSHVPTTINSSKPGSKQQVQVHRGNGDRGGVGGGGSSARGFGVGFVLPRLVHDLELRFVRPWVSPLYLSEFRPRFVERSKQWIVRLEVGVKRWVTVQVNRDGTAQVCLRAGDNPLRVPEEFLGFACFFLPWLFKKITGRDVDLDDFRVLKAPELNIDLNGVNLLEGLGARCLTLKMLVENVVRIYYSDPGVKETMPDGGTRVEVLAGSYQGMSLKELVEGITASAELPRFLLSLKKEVEEVKDLVKGGVSLKGLEKQGFADLVATKLANYLEILWKRIEARLQQWIRELASKIAEAVQKYVEQLLARIKQLENENKQLKKQVEEFKNILSVEEKLEELRKHPGWPGLAELADRIPPVISIDASKGMVYFSKEVWEMIRLNNGLPAKFLTWIHDNYGNAALKLIREMQLRGGKIPIEKALEIMAF